MSAPAALRPLHTGPRLSLLGSFDLSCCSAPVELRAPAQRLLAFLAVHSPRVARRQSLARQLWSDADPRRASASLRSALCRLPRPHGRPLVVALPTGVRLAPDVEVDLWEGEQAVRSLVTAVSERRASATAGHRVSGCNRLLEDDGPLWAALTRDLLPDWHDDWLLVEQESYRQLRLHALEDLSVELRTGGRHGAALRVALAAVRGEPLRETAHRRVIEVHLAEGNSAEALRQYQLYRHLLAEELGLPPSPGIRRLVAPLLGRPVDLDDAGPC